MTAGLAGTKPKEIRLDPTDHVRALNISVKPRTDPRVLGTESSFGQPSSGSVLEWNAAEVRGNPAAVFVVRKTAVESKNPTGVM